MNFATLKGLTIPEGVVTQITDASGRVIWKKIRFAPVLELGMVTFTSEMLFKTYSYQISVATPNDILSANALMIGDEVILLPYTSSMHDGTNIIARSTKEGASMFPNTPNEIFFQYNMSSQALTIRSYDNLGTCNVTIGII